MAVLYDVEKKKKKKKKIHTESNACDFLCIGRV